MIPFGHIIEVAGLILTGYLGGCCVGYGAHFLARRIFASGVAISKPILPEVAVHVPPSAARRLARVAEDVPMPALAVEASRAQRPPELPAPRRGGADDLRKIKGIGQKTESALHDLGIYHYDQIAAWQAVHVDWLEGRIAIKGRIRREQWVEQATLLLTAPKSDAA